MNELEQLRKEVNELRERVAQLERNQRKFGPFGPAPAWPPIISNPWMPPNTITCSPSWFAQKAPKNYDPSGHD